jgi:hypothetical protein
MNSFLAPDFLKHAADQGSHEAQPKDVKFQANGNPAETETHVPEGFLDAVTGQSGHEADGEDAESAFRRGVELCGDVGLNHLKFAADAGFATAEFSYHLVLDELTGDL